jgi:hypothetical protein
MCSWRVSLIRSSIAASVVDLPEPVGPVTSTKPRGFFVNSSSVGGSPSELSFGMSCGIRRNAADSAARCMYAFTRKRALPGIE